MERFSPTALGDRLSPVVLCVLVPVMLVLAGQPSAAAPHVWVVSSLERVAPDAAPGTGHEVLLYAARGEYESFQIVIRASDGGLTNVNVSAPDLVGQGGSRVARSNITLYREHYVYVSKSQHGGQNRSEGPGWYPDGLIPFVDPATGADLVGAELDAVPFDLASGRNQGIWVDVFVPRNASAGRYSGTFVVTSDQGDASVELTLAVWNFELPLRPSLKSSIGLERDLRASGEELLRNKLMPRSVEVADESEFISDYGLNCTHIGFWSGADNETCSMSPAPSVDDIRDAAGAHAPGLFLYAYTADEIDSCTGLHESLKQWARNLHQAGVKQMVTMTPVPELYDDGSGTGRSAVDIWVLLPHMHDAAAARVASVQRKGDETWSYNCLVQDDYSPKWEIDFAPINFRIQPGFMNQSLGMTGLLYWTADTWTSDPWNDVSGYSPAYPGEGMLIYPGEQVGIDGVCPSMRLKWLRDGVEDYEYIELHKATGHEQWAIDVARRVATDWRNWTRDPATLEEARHDLGEGLVRVFYDVPSDHWAFEAIEVAHANGVVTGYADGGYHPAWDVTRGQMAVFIARAAVTPMGEDGLSSYAPPTTPTFRDVPTTYWCFQHVEYLTAEGIIGGYPDGRYRPTTWVTRDQMAVYIARATAEPRGEAGLDGYVPPEEPTFGDVPADFWSRRHIEYLAETGVVAGFPDGLYRPQRRVTRDQMAVYISRAFGLL